MLISTDILWRVFYILTEPTFVLPTKPVPGLLYSVSLRMQTFSEPVPLKYGKLATKYPWIYGYVYSVGLHRFRFGVIEYARHTYEMKHQQACALHR